MWSYEGGLSTFIDSILRKSDVARTKRQYFLNFFRTHVDCPKVCRFSRVGDLRNIKTKNQELSSSPYIWVIKSVSYFSGMSEMQLSCSTHFQPF